MGFANVSGTTDMSSIVDPTWAAVCQNVLLVARIYKVGNTMFKSAVVKLISPTFAGLGTSDLFKNKLVRKASKVKGTPLLVDG